MTVGVIKVILMAVIIVTSVTGLMMASLVLVSFLKVIEVLGIKVMVKKVACSW